MKLLIEINYNYFVIEDSEKFAAAFELFRVVQNVESVYENGRTIYTPKRLSAKFSLIEDEDFGRRTELMEDITRAAKLAEDRWMKEYTERLALEKELTKLKSKVALLNVSEEEKE